MAAATQISLSVNHGEAVIRAARYAFECDAQLMSRVRDGDSQAYTLLVHRYQRPLIHFLFRIVRSQHVAEELAQEVFLRVYRSRATYEPSAKFSTWLFRIATHVAINWLRDGKYEKNRQSLDEQVCAGTCRQLRDRASTAEERLVAGVKVRQIREAIDSLPANQRAAVFMHKYEELAYSEIALALSCSEGAVKSLLFRAYERLRTQLVQFSA